MTNSHGEKEQNMKLKLNDYETQDAVKIMREWTGKTQREFAESISHTEDHISKMETGRRNIYLHTFIDMAKKNGIDIYIEKKKD